MSKCATVGILFFGISHLYAEVPVKDYRTALSNPDSAAIVKSYVSGLGNGMVYANEFSQRNKQAQPLFCAPSKLTLTGDNFVNLLDAQIKLSEERNGKEPTMNVPIGLLLLEGLVDTFPCEKKRSGAQ